MRFLSGTSLDKIQVYVESKAEVVAVVWTLFNC